MRLLLDTNILIVRSAEQRQLNLSIVAALDASDNQCFASVVSLWEIAIKARISRVDSPMSAAQTGDYFDAMSIPFLPITREHVLAELMEQPSTRDPFDRLLLAICQVEGLRLITLDRALTSHPLAWR